MNQRFDLVGLSVLLLDLTAELHWCFQELRAGLSFAKTIRLVSLLEHEKEHFEELFTKIVELKTMPSHFQLCGF